MKLRKQPVRAFSSWDFGAEPGDRVYKMLPSTGLAHIADIRESRGRDKAAAGELVPVWVKKKGKRRVARRGSFGVWYW